MTAWAGFLFAWQQIKKPAQAVKNVSPHHILHRYSGIVCLNWPHRHITKAERVPRGVFSYAVTQSELCWNQASNEPTGEFLGIVQGFS